MKVMNKTIVSSFQQAETVVQWEEVQRHIAEGGYSSLNELLDYLIMQIRNCDDDRLDGVRKDLKKAQQIVPNPGEVSPSWEGIWDKFAFYLQHKEDVLRRIALEDRDGEWQVVMDNPYTNESIVCYPGLSFLEAAYLYAYFRESLKKNEYIRLQKVMNLIATEGN